MAIDIVRLYEDKKIEHYTSGAEVTQGWVNVQCPFCGDDKWHLGYSQELDLFTCWKCGTKNRNTAIARILKIDYIFAEQLAKEYFILGSKTFQAKKDFKSIVLPENFGTLKKEHRRYLKKRGFDPIEMKKKWGLVGADDDDYYDRILIPIRYKGELVSFHSRSIDPDCIYPAKACESDKEAMRHKELLYGFDHVPGNTVIVSEGPADVWRWGYGAVATFGIKFTEQQTTLLSCFKNIFIVFDSGDGEKQSQEQAEKLADRLSVFNNVWIIDELKSDPGDLSQRKADKIKNKINEIVQQIK